MKKRNRITLLSAAERHRRERAKYMAWLHATKSVPCADCGGRFDPVCMDFDHRPGTVKAFAIGKNVHGWESMKLEIAKCDIVCANCHRIRTHRQRDHRASCSRRRPLPTSTQTLLRLEAA